MASNEVWLKELTQKKLWVFEGEKSQAELNSRKFV
jgi:hypothetical protein